MINTKSEKQMLNTLNKAFGQQKHGFKSLALFVISYDNCDKKTVHTGILEQGNQRLS